MVRCDVCVCVCVVMGVCCDVCVCVWCTSVLSSLVQNTEPYVQLYQFRVTVPPNQITDTAYIIVACV